MVTKAATKGFHEGTAEAACTNRAVLSLLRKSLYRRERGQQKALLTVTVHRKRTLIRAHYGNDEGGPAGRVLQSLPSSCRAQRCKI